MSEETGTGYRITLTPMMVLDAISQTRVALLLGDVIPLEQRDDEPDVDYLIRLNDQWRSAAAHALGAELDRHIFLDLHVSSDPKSRA